MALSRGIRFGPYEIVEPIGAGGMGEVYRATDTTLDRQVAVKVLPEAFASDADRVARFEAEAKTLASLNHPNIAQIYGLERGHDVTALVMELIDGPTLAERLEQGALPFNEAITVATQITDALEAAHGQGIVHRDLKPANIKLLPNGTVKVLDFGIAKVLELRASSGERAAPLTTPAMTAAGIVLGTAAYMSPEQARGKPIDERADIWAFGAVLYEMLTGQPAFGGEDVTITLARVLERNMDLSTLPKSISPAVRQTLLLCLQKNPRNRVADIRDVKLALEGAFDTASLAAPTPPWRRAAPITAGFVVGAVVVGALVWSLRTPPPRPVSRLLVTPPADAPLSAIGGYDVMISPDGSQLVYYAQVDGNSRVELYLRDLDSLEAWRLPGTEVSTTGGNMLPFYSPDGTNIGFRSPGQGLMRVSVTGGPPINILPDTVIDNPQYLGSAWASDGTLIFSTGQGLYRVSAGGGGTPERLTTPPESPATRFVAPVLLPGEHGVVFTIDDARIMVLDLESGEERVLIEGGKNPFYSPSGHLVFARDSTLMAMPFDLKTLTVSGEPAALLQGIRYPGGGTATDFAVSASGTLIYIPGGEEDSFRVDLSWVDRDGQTVASVIGESIENPRDPRLSPDGNRLALTTGSLTDGDLWIYDLSGRPPIPVAIEGDNRAPVWSADGSELAFVSNRPGQYGVYRLPANGSVLDLGSPLPGSAGTLPQAWLGDGTLIGTTVGGVPNIHASDLDGPGQWQDVVATTDAEFDPAMSPDGRWLAYVSTRTGAPEIWARAYPDGVPLRVSRSGGYEPRWSADGTELFYRQGTTLYAVSVTAEPEFSFGAETALFNEPFRLISSFGAHSYDVAADGRFLMIRAGDANGDQGSTSIVVVQNFDEELEARVPAR